MIIQTHVFKWASTMVIFIDILTGRVVPRYTLNIVINAV